jgi:uncharacterized protein
VTGPFLSRFIAKPAKFAGKTGRPGIPQLAAGGLAVGLVLLAIGLQLTYRPLPPRFSVPIHDGAIPVASAARMRLPPAPDAWPEPLQRLSGTTTAADLTELQGIVLPAAPELAAALARGPSARVATRLERDGGASAIAPLPALPVPGVVVGTLAPPPAAGQPGPAPLAAPEVAVTPPETGAVTPALPVLASPPAAGGPAWTRYRRAFTPIPDRPRIAVVLWGLGRNAELSAAAISSLPGELTLGMTPENNQPQHWADRARAAGHELLVEVPMEPLGYPDLDPGPQALLTTLPEAENLHRLERWLDGFTGHIGITNLMGSRFTASPEHMRPVLERLQRRGLVFLDSRASGDSVAYAIARDIGLDRAVNNRYIDNEPTPGAIDAQLGELELAARNKGAAVGIGNASAATLERLQAWLPTLAGKELQLAPLSAVLQRGEAR